MEHVVQPLRPLVLLGEDVRGQVAGVQGLFAERVHQSEALHEETVTGVGGLGVEVSGYDDGIGAPRLLDKLVDLEKLAISVSAIQL